MFTYSAHQAFMLCLTWTVYCTPVIVLLHHNGWVTALAYTNSKVGFRNRPNLDPP